VGNGNRMLILERQHSMWAEAPVNKRNPHLLPIFQQSSFCRRLVPSWQKWSGRHLEGNGFAVVVKVYCVNRWLVPDKFEICSEFRY
jgi:hypothetical protein